VVPLVNWIFHGVVHLDSSRYRIQPLATELLPLVQDPIEGQAAGVAAGANRDDVPQLGQTRTSQLAGSVFKLKGQARESLRYSRWS